MSKIMKNVPGDSRKPEWLKIPIRSGRDLKSVEDILKESHLNAVCQEANCPNKMECYSRKTATFMILGAVCTRQCRFCNVTKGEADSLDPEEPKNLARAVEKLGLKYVVVTSVTRDDLPDGGAGHFAAVIDAIRRRTPDVTIEVLIPDFQGSLQALKTVLKAAPDVINHNIETVSSLYETVRPQADYHRSLELIKRVKETAPRLRTKSGIMVGLGETPAQVEEVMDDLLNAGCDSLTIGQYLAPSREHLKVVEYIHPDQFEAYRQTALIKGFKAVASAPFVRSSYHAEEIYND